MTNRMFFFYIQFEIHESRTGGCDAELGEEVESLITIWGVSYPLSAQVDNNDEFRIFGLYGRLAILFFLLRMIG